MKPNEIEGYLNANGIYPDSIYLSENGIIEIVIYDGDWKHEHGDWKHEHGSCKRLMEKVGYTRAEFKVIEDSDSDYFSAVHLYKI